MCIPGRRGLFIDTDSDSDFDFDPVLVLLLASPSSQHPLCALFGRPPHPARRPPSIPIPTPIGTFRLLRIQTDRLGGQLWLWAIEGLGGDEVGVWVGTSQAGAGF
ncbi:MAG TPA: hypothetical protein DEW46_05545, partial [Verrucomicrobia bacterium]|nr:hypothetical protein [Verrucomicrobiota bacterium]